MAMRRRRFSFARFSCFRGQTRVKMAEDGYPVKLHIYDLSQGMARQLSSTILGKAIDAIWHTGVVVYGKEYFFGGGIQKDRPGRTPYGTPVRVEDLGVTHVPREIFEDFLREIGPRYTPATYSLLSNNCNNFSDEAAQFLVGSRIPGYILELPNEVKNSPIGALIMPMIQGLETTLRAGAAPQPPQFKSAPAAAAAAAAETQSSSDSIHVRPKSAATDQTDADDNGSRIPAAAASSAPVVAESEVSTSAAVDKTDAEEAADHGRRIPPAAEPSAPVVAEVSTAAAMDKMDADKAADNGSRIPPAVQPAPVEAAAAALAAPVVAEVSTAAAEPAPAAPAAAAAIAAPVVAEVSTSAVAAAAAEPPEDPLREAKNRVREEIKREFAAIMATGAAQAGEAAALATRRVMERHGVRCAAAAAGGVQRG